MRARENETLIMKVFPNMPKHLTFIRLLTYVKQCVAINCFMLVGKPLNIIVYLCI